MSNRFIYVQNCLQQDFWINFDPQGNIGVQVHNTTCIHGVKSTEEKQNPLRAPWVMKGSRWESLNYCKAQDTKSPASGKPSSTNYLLRKALDKEVTITHYRYNIGIMERKNPVFFLFVLKATQAKKKLVIKDIKHLTVIMQIQNMN